jgi:hypothetical protein
MLGGVGAGGCILPATRFGNQCSHLSASPLGSPQSALPFPHGNRSRPGGTERSKDHRKCPSDDRMAEGQ